MHRRSVLARCGALVAGGLGGCLEVRPLEGAGGDDTTGEGSDGSGGEGGDDGATSPGDDEFYASGTMAVVVDGAPVDLTADRFQAEYADEAIRFHFHEGDENWHMESERVTFAEAVDLLPRFAYDRQGDAHVVTVDGERYDGRDAGITIAFRVDGESVDPVAYDVQDGDHLVLEVTTDG